jgi:hypothetical protein
VCSDAEKDRRRTHRRGKTPRISPQFLLHNPRKNERVEVADQKLDFFNGLLENGTVVILSTMPPRSGHMIKAQQFAEVARKIAREQQVPLLDYFGEILKRRPDDWDGSLPQFKGSPGDEYQVPTLIARDGVHPSNPKQFFGDYSDEALRTSGYGLRNFLTLMAYAEVVRKVCD